MRKILFVSALALGLAPAAAFAQASTATGAVGGAAAGAVVGGVAGATVGMAAEPPAEVRTYVMKEQVPSVAVQEKIVVGEPLPATVQVRTIPSHQEYAYAVVNNQRVIVEPKTRKVVKIYN